jgi:hypothetical protein
MRFKEVPAPTDNTTIVAREPWDPTPDQERVALELSGWGGYARTLPDGLAELRAITDGKHRTYVIRKDGTATLVEARAPGLLHEVGTAFYWIAGAVFLEILLPWWPDSWVTGTWIAVVAFLIGGGLLRHLGLGPRGGWTYITRYPADGD